MGKGHWYMLNFIYGLCVGIFGKMLMVVEHHGPSECSSLESGS